VFFAQVALAARHTSITLDEPLHMTSGYASLVTGDYRLVEEHPPLLKMWQALPLMLARPPLPDPRTVPGWEEGNLIVTAQNVVVPYRPIEPLLFAARVPTMLVGVLLAALVYRWAVDTFGAGGGLLALTLYTFEPNMLAQAGVAATDLGAACAIFAAMYVFWRWIRQRTGPAWKRALVAGFVLGLALGVKSTVLILGPIFGAFILWGRPAGHPFKPYLKQALVAGGVAFVVLWALYRFEVGAVPGWSFTLPAPSHFLPLLKLQEHVRTGHSAFLMGQNYHYGVWYYFPIAFALKTPPLLLSLLFLTTLGLLLRRAPSPSWRWEAALLALPVLYFAISMTSTLNIGYRHLLPVLPFLFVWVSRLAPAICHAPTKWRRAVRLGLVLALVVYAAYTLLLFPWHLAYFNFIAGGPDGGYRYLTDSNLDWGQTWKALRQYLKVRDIGEFGLSQYTINDPRAYGLDYEPLPPWPEAPPILPRRFNPAPGVYAISATTLQGVVVADPEMFDYFRKIDPVERVGHAMFVYEVKADPPVDWAAQCTNPVTPLPPDLLLEGLGVPDLRIVYFDCSQSWVYPPGNGWYVLPRELEMFWVMTAGHTQRARLAYEQTQTGFVPPFGVYEWFRQDALQPLAPVNGYAAPGAWPPSQVREEGTPLTTPVQVGEALEFLGYDSGLGDEGGRTGTVETWWRVVQGPAQPLSMMAHLLDANGNALAVGDGLGFSVEQWQPGDVLVQRHSFDLAEIPLGRAWLQVGAYTLPDVQRLPVQAAGTLVGDRLLLGPFQLTDEVTVP
jgi:hypothetical protein